MIDERYVPIPDDAVLVNDPDTFAKDILKVMNLHGVKHGIFFIIRKYGEKGDLIRMNRVSFNLSEQESRAIVVFCAIDSFRAGKLIAEGDISDSDLWK